MNLQNEVDLLSKIQHPNIISLLGCSINGDMRFIVYELMQNGSLEALLHGNVLYLMLIYIYMVEDFYNSQLHNILNSVTFFFFFFAKFYVEGPSHGLGLTWHMRMKIALDTAR